MLNATWVVLNLLLALAVPQEAPPLASQDGPSTAVAPAIVQTLPLDDKLRASLQSALDRRDYSRAEALLVGELNRNPKSHQLLLFLSSVSFLNGNYLNAAIATKKAEALGPISNRDRFTLAMAYVALERPDWARPELEKLAQSGERNPLYLYWLSRLDYNDMNFTSALINAREAIKVDPAFMRGYDSLGLSYEAIGDLENAAESFRAAASLNREGKTPSPWPAMNLGRILIKLGQLLGAEASLKDSLSYDPRFPQAHFQLGLLLEKENRNQEAMRELEKAAEFDPTYPEPHYALGRILKRLGEGQKAKLTWAKFRELKDRKAKAAKLRKQSR